MSIRAEGFGRGEGVAALLLKPLKDALRDGDPIRAVIRETALNQDGRTPTITSPSQEAQEELIRMCYKRAGLNPLDTAYVETHGTGTMVGDSIEAGAIGQVLGKGRPADKPLLIGSVKSNIGHPGAASGLAAVVKVALALEHGFIPPNYDFVQESQKIPFRDLGIRVAAELQPWPAHLPRPLGTEGTNSQPSPLHPLPNLTRHVNSTTSTKAQIWAKREDCYSGLGLGGNKIRKLEYVVPSALAKSCDTLISTGGTQSNHMRQVAAFGNSLGLKTVLVPQVHGSSQSEGFEQAGNVQVNRVLGAQYAEPNASLEDVAAGIEKSGGKPYIIASGASTHLHGGLRFARWAFEVVEQETAFGVFFDAIVVPVASGGTIGGMIAGFKVADRLKEESVCGLSSEPRTRAIIGIDTYNKPAGVLEATILEISQRTARLIGIGEDAVQSHDVVLDTRYNAGTHAAWDQHTARAVKLLGRQEGIVTDPIYSSRAMGTILPKAEQGEFDKIQCVLFVHTGGQAALGAFPEMR
ncbi:hypothetical protein NW767_015009 [Fusarium falciforme]|nr:hypothetical protein NW767_015009 [Fusarium falciforme]